MKLIFAGTPEFASTQLDFLVKKGYNILCVITQPDKPVGRKNIITPSAVKLVAQQHNLQVMQPENINSCSATISKLLPDLMIVIAYGQILAADVLAIPTYGCWNVHASILPRWRGAAPIQRCLELGDKTTGTTLMQMDVGLDTGPIIASKTIKVTTADTSATLLEKLSTLGITILQQQLELMQKCIRDGSQLSITQQDSTQVSYAKKVTQADRKLNWHLDAKTLHNRIRAFTPLCWSNLSSMRYESNQIRIKIVASTLAIKPTNQAGVEKIGAIVGVQKLQTTGDSVLLVQTANGLLGIKTLQPAGKKLMSGAEFYNGYKDYSFSNL